MKKGRNSGGKDPDESQLWQHVTRSIRPYSTTPSPPPSYAAKPQKARKPSLPPDPPARKPADSFSADMDDSTRTKLRRGKLPLEGRLDLHGMTQAEAYNALHRFILGAAARGKRTLLVITGKGGPPSGGILKRMLPLWLEDPELKGHVLSITTASPKDGGTGAFYIRLRKAQR